MCRGLECREEEKRREGGVTDPYDIAEALDGEKRTAGDKDGRQRERL